MAKPKENPFAKRITIKEVKAQLDLLTVKLKEYEAARCTVSGCNFVADGLRLAQEVELLQKQVAVLQEENKDLRKQLTRGKADGAV
jgi:hypothetical protein